MLQANSYAGNFGQEIMKSLYERALKLQYVWAMDIDRRRKKRSKKKDL